jgi:hypothetical protein
VVKFNHRGRKEGTEMHRVFYVAKNNFVLHVFVLLMRQPLCYSLDKVKLIGMV